MDTLRRLVEAVLPEPRSDRAKFLSVPDRMSESFELRRLLAPQSRTRPITDFFEYYWAYQVAGTKYGHLIAWLRTLLLRRPRDVPSRLRPLWVVTWLLVVGAGAASIRLSALVVGGPDPDATHRLIVWAISVLLIPVVNGFALGFLGDAARYLSATPQNIAIRHRIRADGMRLLRRLHRSEIYDRIVVVGHSLGSVIAYDILKYYWQEVNTRHGKPLDVDQSALKELERDAQELGSGAEPAAALEQFRERQLHLWQEQRRFGNPWLVTDLVTLGSPLAHAGMLLANSPFELKEREAEMELPVCPPNRNLEGDLSYPANYEVQGVRRTLRVLHHAAMFACTRWTNIYFPGDFVGGALAPLFGKGVRDQKVKDGWISFTPVSHTRYWAQPGAGAKAGEALTTLRDALDLESKSWIE